MTQLSLHGSVRRQLALLRLSELLYHLGDAKIATVQDHGGLAVRGGPGMGPGVRHRIEGRRVELAVGKGPTSSLQPPNLHDKHFVLLWVGGVQAPAVDGQAKYRLCAGHFKWRLQWYAIEPKHVDAPGLCDEDTATANCDAAWVRREEAREVVTRPA